MADLSVGDRVVVPTEHGRVADVRDGLNGRVCIIIAIGPYTQVRTPCGPGVALIPARAGIRTSPRLVVAVPVRRYDYDTDTTVEHWEPWVRSAGQILMSEHEYKVKANVLRKQERLRSRHEAEGQKLRDTAAKALKTVLGVPGATVTWSAKYKRGQPTTYEPSIHIEPEALGKIVGNDDEFVKAMAAVKKWEAKPSPAKCRV